MNIADDLVKAFNEGYAQGKAETEAYLLHCGDVTPVTNADRIRAMTDEELANFLYVVKRHTYDYPYQEYVWLEWLKKE